MLTYGIVAVGIMLRPIRAGQHLYVYHDDDGYTMSYQKHDCDVIEHTQPKDKLCQTNPFMHQSGSPF